MTDEKGSTTTQGANPAPHISEPPEPAWDHEIEWDGPAVSCATLPVWVLTELHSIRYRDGFPRVACIRPADSSQWMAFRTGHFDHTLIGDEAKHGYEVRMGHGAAGCIERMADFVGW